MKAKLVLVYEREVDQDSIAFLMGCKEDNDQQALFEFFGVGWEDTSTPIELEIEGV